MRVDLKKSLFILPNLFTLSSVLRRAVKAGELPDNPVRRVDKPRIDRRGKVRFLDEAEEFRLRTALQARDELMKKSRETANVRHLKRGETLLPLLKNFGDHLTPAVLCADGGSRKPMDRGYLMSRRTTRTGGRRC